MGMLRRIRALKVVSIRKDVAKVSIRKAKDITCHHLDLLLVLLHRLLPMGMLRRVKMLMARTVSRVPAAKMQKEAMERMLAATTGTLAMERMLVRGNLIMARAVAVEKIMAKVLMAVVTTRVWTRAMANLTKAVARVAMTKVLMAVVTTRVW